VVARGRRYVPTKGFERIKEKMSTRASEMVSESTGDMENVCKTFRMPVVEFSEERG
jgi:hypothetical protein